MPNLFQIGSYKVFFWSNENNEPIHVHIAKGKPTQNSTKVWITSAGGCIIANNASKIPDNELNKILEIISNQYFFICSAWKKHFVVDEIKYFC